MVKLKDLVQALKASGFNDSDELSLQLLSPDVIALARQQGADQLKEKILSLINEKPFKERVQGRFEKLLSEEGRKKLNELLDSGDIEVYQKKEFKQGVYVLPRHGMQAGGAIEGQSNASCMQETVCDDFIVTNNEFQAKALSQKFEKEIKSGLIKGLKSFDGNYYIAKTGFISQWRDKIFKELSQKKAVSLNDLCVKNKWDKKTAKIVLEFMKEDGDVLEKRKDVYQRV